MNYLPSTVKPLAEKEIAGCKIKQVERKYKGDKLIYAITSVDQAGILMEVEYSEDWTLISKGRE